MHFGLGRQVESPPIARSARQAPGGIADCFGYGWLIWVTHMKTTLDIDDRLLARAKRHASAHGMTLRAVVEEALRARLAPRPEERARYRFAPPTVRGTSPPAIDVADRNALYELLDDRR